MILSEQNPAAINRFKLVWVMGFTQIFAWASSYYLPAVLAPKIAADTGWAMTTVVGGLSWGMLVAGASAPTVGRQIDRHGGRSVLAVSSLLLALGMLIMGLAYNVAAYYLAWTMVGFAMAAGLYDAAFSTLARLFGDSSRTSITGLTLIAGFASTVGWPLIAGLESSIGWRGTCFALAAIHLLICFPMHRVLIPGRSQQPSLPVIPEPEVEPGARCDYLFIWTAFILTALALVVSGMSVHLLNILQLLGIATAVSLTLGMVFGPAQGVARITEFSLGSNLHPTWSTRIGLLLCIAGLGLLTPGVVWLAFVAIALYGAGSGILTIVRGTLPLALFGPRGYGARMGRLARPILVAQACGPIAAAFVLHRFGAQMLLGLMCTILVLCCVATWRLPGVPIDCRGR